MQLRARGGWRSGWWVSQGPRGADLAEAVAGLCVAGAVLWMALGAWGWYEGAVRPHLQTEAPLSPPRARSVRADDAAAVRSLQRSTNLMGEAGTYLAEEQYAWARATLERVLELDPGNAEARALLAQLPQLDPPPTASTAPPALPPAGSAAEANLVAGAGGG